MKRLTPKLVASCCTVMGAAALFGEATGGTSTRDLGDLSLEELMNETVTSVSKREQKLSDAATAITVLSNDDLRRSGATNIADALRLVPGMNVGSVNSNQWAVTARGFNSLYANKLLVLVDGRAVYTQLFAGVHWDLEQTMLEDVDRIEVIRGPGATVWGANAVNGVINVVTRSAKDTQGGLLYGSAGDVQETNNGVRYGGRLDDKTYYRVYAGYLSKDAYLLPNGQQADDGWAGDQAGFRLDRYPDDDTQLTWLAGMTEVDSDNDVLYARNLNTLGRLTRNWGDRSSFEFQAYYDQTLRDDGALVRMFSDTVDFTAQHTFGLGERNDVIWGAGYRFVNIKTEETNAVIATNATLKAQLYSFFIQDEFRLVPDKVTLTAGVKLEHNDFTGVEVQPGIRGVFKPTAQQTLWAAVSRAVRTPSAVEGKETATSAVGPPFAGPGGLYVPTLTGNSDASSEVLWAYELGYRIQPTPRISVDVALFYNEYSDVIAFAGVTRLVPGVPVGTAEIPFSNVFDGHTYGGEISLAISVTDSWRLAASYSLLLANIDGPVAANPEQTERSAPRHQIVLRSTHDLSQRLSLEGQIRYVDAIYTVPAYITADLRISYRITDELEFSLVGQNLLEDQHQEAGAQYFVTPNEVPRGFYGKLTWRF